MADAPDRSTKPIEGGQTFPLTPFTDFSRFDKLAMRQKTDATSNVLPQLDFSSIFKVPSISDKPGSMPDKTLPVPPLPQPGRPDALTDTVRPPADRSVKLKPGQDGKIEITEKDFDKIGPKAAQVLKEAGVVKLTVTPGKGFDTYETELKKPLEIPQDPTVDGTRKLKLATHFKVDISKQPDGTLQMENIEGLSAETKVLFSWKEAQINRIQIKQTADGKSEIKSTGSWNGFSRDNVRVKDGEIFEKANFLFDRMRKLKEQAEIK